MNERYYHISPELRRSATYAMVGFALIGVTFFCLARIVGQRPATDAAVGAGFFVLVAVAMAIPLRWCLRVDRRGISRRRLCRWDFWSWDDFGSGRIEKRHHFALVDPNRPWWHRTLRLDYLAEHDITEVMERINVYYLLPPSPPIPNTLDIKYEFRRSARLSWRGIQLTVRGEAFEYGWKDVGRLHVTRRDPKRRDFTRLEVVLPDQRLEFKFVSRHETPTWRGAGPELLSEFLLAHVPTERIDIDIEGQRPAKPIDVEARLHESRKDERQFRVVTWILAISAIAALIWMAAADGVPKALFMTGMLALHSPILWFVRTKLRARTRQLEAWHRQDMPLA